VAKVTDIQRSQMKEFQVNNQSICIANIDGKYFALNNVCSHEGGPLADGKLEGYEVECPWHQSRFDVRTGDVKAPPAIEPQASYTLKVEGDDIMIDLDSTTQVEKQETEGSGTSEYSLILQERIPFDGTDILTLKFDKQEKQQPNTIFSYTAGQFAFFDIGNVINDAKGPIRHFTIASSPTEDFILISTRIRESPYKQRLNSLENGAVVKVRGPQGKFTLHDDYSKPAIFLSGGIGVTPFRSIIKYATDKNLPIRIIMFDSNRNPQNILYKIDFDNWLKINQNLRIIHTVTEAQTPDADWKGEKGRIDIAMLKKHTKADDLEKSIFYICGPPAMVKAMKEILEQNLKIPTERIRIEVFTGY
jgi:ferredoxin-NADP reductase/nitrite reductase/ring-hydroxylating ferredoxin subunit